VHSGLKHPVGAYSGSVESVPHRKTRNKHYDTMQGPSLPVLGSVPIIPHTFSILFRLSGPRTWVFPSFSFILGYVVVGGGQLSQIGIGIAVASLITAATNIVNAYADRKEDATNQPQRLFWLGQIGSRQITASLVVLYSSAAALALYLGPLFTLVLGVGILNSIFYSLPPLRFKAKPFASLASFSGALGLPFLGGLSVRGSLDLLNPMLWLLTWFMFTYGTVKNLPDYFGDMKAGIRTSATVFKNVKNAVLFSSTLLSTPFILLVTFVSLGLLQPIYIADLLLLPLFAFIITEMLKAKDAAGLEKAHTLGFFYAISFLLFTLVLTSPTIQSLVLVFVAYLWALTVAKVSVHSRVESRDWEKQRRKKE
jgi:4-hydroxybenzoate polyprenyltransferase